MRRLQLQKTAQEHQLEQVVEWVMVKVAMEEVAMEVVAIKVEVAMEPDRCSILQLTHQLQIDAFGLCFCLPA